jgi:hypothetical protein
VASDPPIPGGDVNSATGALASLTPGAQRPGVQQVVQMVPTEVTVPNQMSIWAINVDVSFVRWWAGALALLFAALGFSGAVISSRARQRGEPAYIAARYGSKLIPLRSMPDVRSNAPFELTNFDALLAVSAQLGLPVMVDDSGPEVSYYVADVVSTFRYTAPRPVLTKREERRQRAEQRHQQALDAKNERQEAKRQAKAAKKRARFERKEQKLQAKLAKERAALDAHMAAAQAKLDARQAKLEAKRPKGE